MSTEYPNAWSGRSLGRVSRRRLFKGGVMVGAGLAGAALVGCGGEDATPTATATGPQAAGTTAAGAAATPASAAAPARPGVPVVTGTPKDGGTLTETAASTSPQNDMHTALNRSIWHYISERALLPDPWTGEVTAGVVESWEVPDTTTIVMHVRPGVYLHDVAPWNGREFDAEDLAFNINRIAGNTAEAEGLSATAFQRKTTLSGMEKVEAVDKYTVKVTMAKPSSAYLKGFLEWRNVMMPKGIVEVGFDDPMKFAGVGAFHMADSVPEVREEFAKHPKYYRAGEPHYAKVVNTVVTDAAALLAGFISKQFATYGGPTPQNEQTIKAARPDALFYSTPGNQWFYLRPNMQVPVFSDFRVRKALQLSIDFPEIAQGYYGDGWDFTGPVFSGFADSWSGEKIKSLPGYNPDTKAADIAEAKKMLAAAGHENGDGIAFTIGGGPGTGTRLAQKENSLRFQAQMKKLYPAIGIEINILGDAAQWANALAAKNLEMVSFSSVPQPAAAAEAASLFHSQGGRNYGNFAEPEADVLLDKAAETLDLEERTAVFDTFQEKLENEWMPAYSLFVQPSKTFVQPNIGGYDQVVGPWSQGLVYHRVGVLYEVA